MEWGRLFIRLLLAIALVTTTAVFLLTRGASAGLRATVAMGFGLLLIWVVLLGGAMYLFRDPLKKHVQAIRLPYWLKFFLLFLGLALIEEMISTGMTNAAPFFGASIGEAYITASSNYWDVVFHHSIILFLPAMLAWTFLVTRYHFSHFSMFLMWGIFGLLAEIFLSGIGQLPAFAFWIFVYGLMIWFPAYTLPQRNAKALRFYHYLFPYALTFALLLGMFVLWAALGALFPESYFAAFNSHPKVHFPPIQ